MATTTPNFGWSVPTSTDYVKDGATAIETLGDAIDASLVDLKGGTTGQVLSKNSNTDMDFTWVTQDDANAIQNTIVDAKGDLISATAADTPARLAVGTNGQVLTADSTAATGLKWDTIATSGPAFRAYFTGSDQTPTSNTWTLLQLASETFDTASCFDPTTSNYKFTPNKAGYYQINIGVKWTDSFSSNNMYTAIYKNGTRYSWSARSGQGSSGGTVLHSDIVYCNGTTDYIQAYVKQDGTGNKVTASEGDEATFMSGHWIAT